MAAPISPKSRLVALLLCWFLGIFGAHRFYVGKNGTAALMIGGLGIWALVDLIIVCGGFTDKNGLKVFQWMEPGS
jgi:TM2 domain-containing membrane protein YozV